MVAHRRRAATAASNNDNSSSIAASAASHSITSHNIDGHFTIVDSTRNLQQTRSHRIDSQSHSSLVWTHCCPATTNAHDTQRCCCAVSSLLTWMATHCAPVPKRVAQAG